MKFSIFCTEVNTKSEIEHYVEKLDAENCLLKPLVKIR